MHSASVYHCFIRPVQQVTYLATFMNTRPLILLLFCCIILAANPLQAQQAVRGQVHGPDSTFLADASVSLLRQTDSSLAIGTLTDSRGRYLFTRPDTGRYLIYITAVGCRPHIDTLTVFRANPLPRPAIYLKAQPVTDSMVTVSALVPIVVKKDTLEMNPNAWKQKPNDAVADLLKRIPGFSIGADGGLSYLGEKITAVLVDGKPFQLSDVATLNTLPINIIEKIQVIDQKPKEEKFSKTDNGERNKVLNLTVKKDKKKGWFGDIKGSAATNGQRQEAISINRFLDKRKMGLNLGDNELVQTQAGKRNSTRGQNGDFTFNNEWAKERDLSARGSFNHSEGNNTRSSVRQTFLQNDTVLITRNQGVSNFVNNNQQANGGLNWEIDSTAELNVDASLSHNNSRSQNNTGNSSTNNFGRLINRSANTSNSSNDGLSANAGISYSKQLDTNGRYFYVRMGFNMSENKNDSYNQAANDFYNADGSFRRQDRLNQYRNSNTRNRSYQFSANYNLPLNKDYTVSLGYSFNYNNSRSLRNTYDYDSLSGKFSQLNQLQSNGFNNQGYTHRQSIGLGRRFNKLYLNLRLGLQQNKQFNKNLDSAQTLTQRFFNITPGFNLSYYHKTKGNFRFNYNGNTNQPSLAQRQPVIDNSNPLFLRSGNPNLRPEYNNQFSLKYSRSNRARARSVTVSIDFSNTFNKITDRVQYDSEGKQFSKPENVEGNYRGNLNLGYNFNLSQKSKSSVGINGNINKSRTVGFLNGLRNTGNSLGTSMGAQAAVNIKEWLSINGGGGFQHNETRYSVGTRNNRNFNSFNLSLDVDVTLPHNWELSSDVQYNNRGNQVDFGRETTLWNMSMGKLLFEKKMSIRLRVSDLLLQNIGYNRTTGGNYIEETENGVPGRFFQLSIVYSFRRFGR
jgi:hypothetical protein